VPIHDLICPNDHLVTDIAVIGGVMGKCDRCGEPRRVSWLRGMAPSNDCYGAPRDIESLGLRDVSRSDVKAHLKANAWEEAGDRVHGARNTERYEGKGFSYSGQASRASTTG